MERNITEFDVVNAPSHYVEGREYEPAQVFSARNMRFDIGNACKYVSRMGRKKSSSQSEHEKTIQDLDKAIWYAEFFKEVTFSEEESTTPDMNEVIKDWQLPPHLATAVKHMALAQEMWDEYRREGWSSEKNQASAHAIIAIHHLHKYRENLILAGQPATDL